MLRIGSFVAIALLIAPGAALARSGTPSMHGVANGGGIGMTSPFTHMTGVPSYTGVGPTGMVGSKAAQYGHVGGMVSGPGGDSGYSGATMHGTATGGASRTTPSAFLGAGTGGTGGASGM
jgi:hypothetical protein